MSAPHNSSCDGDECPCYQAGIDAALSGIDDLVREISDAAQNLRMMSQEQAEKAAHRAS